MRKTVVEKESVVEKAFNYWAGQAWMGAGLGGEWIHAYVWTSPFTVHQKLAQHCESAAPQHKMFLVLKKKKIKSKNKKVLTEKKINKVLGWPNASFVFFC